MAKAGSNNNQLLQKMQKKQEVADTSMNSVKGLLSMDNMKSRFEEVLGKRAPQFMSSLISAVNSNADLQKCVPITVVQSALKAAVLDLPIENNFGFAYLIPYKNNKKGIYECQFQLGYKGTIQLALRTSMYKNINVVDIREGELEKWDPLTEELVLNFNDNEDERDKLPIVGYAGYFGLINGFEKKTFWSLNKLLSHGRKYSAQFRKYGTGNWKDNQDDMCRKTVIKNMLSKWGILSVDMQHNTQLMDAMQADQSVIRENGEYDYVDNVEYDVSDEEDKKKDDTDQIEMPDFMEGE